MTKHQTTNARLADRRRFVGGSDARIIMAGDEAALIRLWKEKRGEAEPEDLSDNLIVQIGVATEALNRTWYERNTGRVITDVQRWVCHPVTRWMAATLDGMVEDPDAGVRGQVHAALVVLRRSGGREAHGPAAAQHVGDQCKVRRAVDHHRRRQMD
jgi:predicted phage-related endonuclease